MEVYGNKGYAIAVDEIIVRERLEEKSAEKTIKLNPRPEFFAHPFSVLSEVVCGRIKLEQNDQHGLVVNVIAVEILEAAKESAKLNKTVFLK